MVDHVAKGSAALFDVAVKTLTVKVLKSVHLQKTTTKVPAIFQPVTTHTHTYHRFRICRQTPTTLMINICGTLQVISVKVQVVTP